MKSTHINFLPSNRTACCGLLSALLFILVACGPVAAADWYVDNVRGSDRDGDGSVESPFRTLTHAQEQLRTSDTLHIVANEVPYNEILRPPVGGTPEAPLIIEGNGAVINRLTHYGPDEWTDEGDGVWRMLLRNNAHVMDGHWSGFDLVFFDGEPGINAHSRDELQPNGYFLFKQRQKIDDEWHPLHNQLFIKLPEGRTPADIKVETNGVDSNVFIERPHTIVRHLHSTRSTMDGFGTGSRNTPGIVFENISSSYNMDQGISHHGSHVVVRDSHFFKNTGGGIVDVYAEVKVHYINCLVEDDLFRGGVELLNGEFILENCIIRNNLAKAMTINRGANVTLRNCIFIGTDDGKASGLSIWEGDVMIENCTFVGFPTAISIGGPTERVRIRNSAFINCGQSLQWQRREEGRPLDIDSDFNFHEPAPLTANGVEYAPGQWTEFVEVTGLEKNSIVDAYEGGGIPWSLPSLQGKGEDGADIGAAIDPMMPVGASPSVR